MCFGVFTPEISAPQIQTSEATHVSKHWTCRSFLGIADSMCCKTHKAGEHWRLESTVMTTGGHNTTRGKLYLSHDTRRACPDRLKINRN